MNENMDKKDYLLKQRPNSSRFPPLVPQTTEIKFRRSSSFDSIDNDIIVDKFESQIPLNRKLLRNESKDFDLKNENSIIKEDIETENLTQHSNNSQIFEAPVALTPFLINKTNNNFEENNRLKKENQILKQNFLRLSKTIQKHSRLMARKDELILKLQERTNTDCPPISDYSNKSQLSIHSNINSSDDNIVLNIDKKNDSIVKNFDYLQNILQKVIHNCEELSEKNSQISQKLKIFTENNIFEDFDKNLLKFNSIIKDLNKFLENNLLNNLKQNEKSIVKLNDENFDKELVLKFEELKAEYSEYKKFNEIISEQNSSFKTIVSII